MASDAAKVNTCQGGKSSRLMQASHSHLRK
jgi:hypothetical protein